MNARKNDFVWEVMPAEAYVGAGSQMINIRQEFLLLDATPVFVRVLIHQRDAENLCEQIMAAAREARANP